MAISATFVADFSSFTAAVEKAETKLTEFRSGASQVEAALKRMGDSFSGKKILGDATLAVKAVQDLGGVTKLTDDEQKRLNATLTTALEKYRALGQQAPADLLAMEAATRKVTTETDKMAAGMQRMGEQGRVAFEKAQVSEKMIAGMSSVGKAMDPLPQKFSLAGKAAEIAQSSFGQLFGAFTAANLVQRGVSALVDFGVAAFETAGKVVDLADKLGVSTDAIQTWDYVAGQTGTTVDALADAAFKLQIRMGANNDEMRQGVTALKLNADALRAMPFEARSDAIMGALSQISSAEERNRIGVLIYGKTFAGVADAVKEDYAELSGAAIKNSEVTLRTLEAVGDEWTRAKGRIGADVTEIMGKVAALLGYIDQQKGFWAQLGTAASFAMNPQAMQAAIAAFIKQHQDAKTVLEDVWKPETIAQGPKDYAAALGKVQAELAKLSPETRKQIDAALALGEKQEDLEERYGLSAGALRLYTAQVKDDTREAKENAAEKLKAEEAQKKWDESYRSLGQTMSGYSGELDANNNLLRTTIRLYQTAPAAIKSLDDSLKGLIPSAHLSAEALMNAATSGRNSMLSIPKDLVSQNVSGPPAVAAGVSMGKSLTTGLKSSMDKMGPTMMAAFTGGGNVAQSVGGMMGGELGGSIGTAVGPALKGALGATLGSALGGMMGPIGTMLGGLAGKAFDKLFGKSEHSKVNDMRDAALSAAGGFEKMNEKAAIAGTNLKKLLDAKTVKDYEAALAELNAKLGDFANEQAADQARLNAAIEKYKFSLEELGPALQAQRLDEQAKELIEDWRVLAAAGVDVSVVNAKMAESVNAYLQAALKVGAEVPNAMRPVLESMAAQGTLVDENGEAITDLEAAGVKFSETMTEGFDRVVTKLDELIAKLVAAGTAVGNIPRSVDVGVNYIPTGGGAIHENPDYPGFAGGTQGRFLDFARGTPVMLHGKERVVTQAEGTAEAAAISDLAAAVAAIPRTISQAVSRAVTDAVVLAR
jgi:hypothetical protein